MTWASPREVTAPKSPSLPSESLGYASAQIRVASGSFFISPTIFPNSTTSVSLSKMEERFASLRRPPSGRTFDRLTHNQINLFANPFPVSVRFRYRRSSSRVMCPMIEMWAPVAFVGEVFVKAWKFPSSQAWRMIGDRVFPSRPIVRRKAQEDVMPQRSNLFKSHW